MYVTYDPLWNILKERKMKKKDLMEIAGVSENVIAKMGKRKCISMKNLARICIALDCGASEVVIFDKLLLKDRG